MKGYHLVKNKNLMKNSGNKLHSYIVVRFLKAAVFWGGHLLQVIAYFDLSVKESSAYLKVMLVWGLPFINITCTKITLSNINFEIFSSFKANALKILFDVMPLKNMKY